MKKTKAFKMLRKALSFVMVLAMVLSLIPANIALADSADLRIAFDTLNALPEASKNTIMEAMWKYAVGEIGNGSAATAQGAVDEVEKALQNAGLDIIGEGDGKVSESALLIMAGEALKYKSTLLYYYDYVKLVDNATIKTALGLPTTATKFQVFNKLILLPGQVITLNSERTAFKKVNSFDTILSTNVSKLNLSDSVAAILKIAISTGTDKALTMLNEKVASGEISITDVTHVLNAYGLYIAPSSGNNTSSNGGGGGGGGGGSSSTDTSSNTGNSDNASNASQNLDKAAESLNSVSSDKAAETAGKAIEGIANAVANVAANPADLAKLTEKAAALAQKAMEKAATAAVAPKVADNAAKAVVSQADVASLASKMDAAVAAAKTLSESLAKSGVDLGVKATLTIDAKANADVNAASVELPAALVAAGVEKALDKIAVVTDVATIAVAPSALPQTEGPVSLSVAKVDSIDGNPVYDFNIKAGDTVVSTFSEPVEISIPYSLKAGEDANKITVFFVNDSGKLENVSGVYDAAKGAVVFTTTHFSKYMIKMNEVSFDDMSAEAWATEYVEVMAAKGIINGTGEGNFAPSNNVTRAEFAAMVVRGFKLSDSTAVSTFSDVSSDDWFYGDVAAAAKLGIVRGNSDGSFNPNANITRQDMAVMIARALKKVKGKNLVSADTQSNFTDSSAIASYAKASIATNVKFGIFKGMTDGSFAPENLATRAEAATVIYKVFFLK